MRLVYFGTAEFAVPALRAVSQHVTLVVSQPDRPSGRGMKLTASPVKEAAMELGLPVETPEKARAPEFLERLRAENADALLVAAYGQILSMAVLESAPRGGINLHGSIQPKYRGAAPIQRCLLNGDTETGVSLMQMDKGMDSGDVIAIERLGILPGETYGELATRLADLAADMAARWMPRIVAGAYPREPQDAEAATYAPKATKEEAEIDFGRPADGEFNRYRAFTPSPGAWIATRFGKLKVSRLAFAEGSGNPGTVLAGAGCRIACGSGALNLLEVQPEGKKRMTGADFANGFRLKPGDSLLA